MSGIVDMNFREYLFHALGCIRARRRAEAALDPGPKMV
jgi:hypothetical protein